MEHDNYILQRYTEEIEFSEIDFDLYDEVLGKDWEDHETITKGEDGKWWVGEGHPIKIERVQEVLNKLKKGGASHVEIMYHCDHIGYVFNGAEIRKATEEEIIEGLKMDEKQAAEFKKKRIAELKAELKELEGE